MKKVTVNNFIRDFIFLTVVPTFSIGRHGLAFSTKTTIQISLSFFFSSLCLHSLRTDFSVSIIIVTYCWFKVVWLEAVTQRCSTEKAFLDISHTSIIHGIIGFHRPAPKIRSPLDTKAPGPPLIYLVAISGPHINIWVRPPNTCATLKQFNLLPPNTLF